MTYLNDVVELISGTPQFRIVEDVSAAAPAYFFYSQADLDEDLKGAPSSGAARKMVRTSGDVITAVAGDVVFSLLSGTAALVLPAHDGYLLTQNYAKLVPSAGLDKRYLVYLLNESPQIRRQLRMGCQGSITFKFTLKQLRGLNLPQLPPCEKQGLIGELYLNQLRLDACRKRAADLETALVLGMVREADLS